MEIAICWACQANVADVAHVAAHAAHAADDDDVLLLFRLLAKWRGDGAIFIMKMMATGAQVQWLLRKCSYDRDELAVLQLQANQ